MSGYAERRTRMAEAPNKLARVVMREEREQLPPQRDGAHTTRGSHRFMSSLIRSRSLVSTVCWSVLKKPVKRIQLYHSIKITL